MGADRKGPLAAFIVVAIIAAILLITSVRSQAATGWLGRAVPSAPEVVRVAGGGLGRLVGQRSDAPASSPQSRQPTTTTPATHRAADPPSRHPTQATVHATVHAATRDSTTPTPTTAPTAGSAPHAVRQHVAALEVADVAEVAEVRSSGRHVGRTHADHGRRPAHAVQVRPGHLHTGHGVADPGHPDHGRHLGRPAHPRG